ncbi:hypothetical protein [Azospirillum himalayense]|uniref:Uncharacterized protein n=1 Tax=Azospirillum himalayense TaxID=654847 RepID=A0ABW0GBD1_9PROT
MTDARETLKQMLDRLEAGALAAGGHGERWRLPDHPSSSSAVIDQNDEAVIFEAGCVGEHHAQHIVNTNPATTLALVAEIRRLTMEIEKGCDFDTLWSIVYNTRDGGNSASVLKVDPRMANRLGGRMPGLSRETQPDGTIIFRALIQ